MNDLDVAILEGNLALLEEENELLRGERDCFEALYRAAQNIRDWGAEEEQLRDWGGIDDDPSDSWKQDLT